MFGGSELLFYNYDAILNNKELIIVEGEIDCLSMIEAGFENVVSVPNGASAKDLAYLDNCYDNLSDINRFYLAVDNDPAGIGCVKSLFAGWELNGATWCRLMTARMLTNTL